MTKENKTTIQGAPREYNDQELKQLQEARQHLYKSFENRERAHCEFAYDFIITIHKKLNEGYTLERRSPMSLNPLSNTAELTLPEIIQEQAIVKLNEQVKQEYIADLQNERDQYKQLLIQQLLEVEEEKERKRQEQAKAKKLAEFEKQAEECFGELKIPG